MDYLLELVLIPVADADRAKDFYLNKAGFDLNVDTRINDEMRVIQVTPHGSACSIGFGTGLTGAAPGSAQGLHLVVSDIVAARDELAGRGVDIGKVRHLEAGQWADGPHPYFFDGLDAVTPLMERAFGPDREGDWRLLPTRANRMPAAASYLRRPGDSQFRAFKLDVLRVRGSEITEITTFGAALFPAFALPETL